MSAQAASSGLLIVDKPGGMTSHDVVAKVRRFLRTRKVGHAGTLDPMATGVLVLGVGRATKLLGHLALDRKAYLATIVLGAATTTDDAEGEVTSSADASGVRDSDIAAEIAALTGDILQKPSAVSAVKVDGKRAYARVRAGEEVDLPARPVTVHRFDVLATRREGQRVELDVMVDCSSGTYVRALARDLGSALGVGGHLAALRRTSVGPFTLAQARTLDEVERAPGLSLSLSEAVAAAFPRVDVAASAAHAIRHGQRIPAAGIDGTYGVFGPDGRVLALARDSGRVAKSVVVLDPA
ncbi:tRNA pseudouridine(55) synthase TruB [Saccharomonospora viridis]|uniref:tRNA pseudouridine synthase B n=2 Tax=Saccharomonospora viridis TaxID=1852 RepID=C7MQV8_SACVD|nr:tRNA pseudouridine(55) synthase TruB [Saccharomonospora viridis]ACU96504.1 tRNA pseudouridine synthase B [Saccharomonospora viridis DSM 43017]KHF42646.1 tRNA pseudouridine synthase B [Saccharomonospora viridis]SFO94784.1 tRNA pseudouridine55 synthase [Saccharomonospora viridis]